MASRILRGGMAALSVCAVVCMAGCGSDEGPEEKAKAGPRDSAPARTSVAAAPVQVVAVYDSRSVLQRSPLPKAMFDEMALRFGRREQELNRLFDDLWKDAAAQESLAGMQMDPKAAKAAKERTRKRGEELTARRDALRKEAEGFRTMLARQMDGLLVKALGSVVQKRNPTIVYDAAAGRIAFYSGSVDVTADVLASLNDLWKASGQRFDLSMAGAPTR